MVAPLPIRVAVGTLLIQAALMLVCGAVTAAVAANLVLFDPTLGGDPTLGMAVGVAVGLTWFVAAAFTVLSALTLNRGAPAGRWLVTALAALLLLTPMIPFAAIVIWGLWLDEEGRAWRVDRTLGQRTSSIT